MTDVLADLSPEDLALAEPSQEPAAEPSEPQVEDPDFKLAKQLNLEALPDDPAELKAAVAKRLTELRSGITEHSTRAKTLEEELSQARIKASMLESLQNMPEWKEFLRDRQTPKSESTGVDGIDVNSPEFKVLARAIDIYMEQKGVQVEQLPATLQSVQGLRAQAAQAELDRLRGAYGEDWSSNEDKIIDTWRRYAPQGMTGEEAFKLVMGDKLKERGRQELIHEIQQKKAATQTLTSPGPGGSVPLDEIGDLPKEAAWQKAFELAKKQLRFSSQ